LACKIAVALEWCNRLFKEQAFLGYQLQVAVDELYLLILSKTHICLRTLLFSVASNFFKNPYSAGICLKIPGICLFIIVNFK
jgi:hypothetical protein